NKILAQLTIKPEPYPNSRTVAVPYAGLHVVFTAYPRIAGQPRTSKGSLELLKLRLLVFRLFFKQSSCGRRRCRSTRGFAGCAICVVGALLRLRRSRLRLLQTGLALL